MNRSVYQIADMPWTKVLMIGIGCLAGYYFAAYDDGTNLTAQYQSTKDSLAEATRQLKNTKDAIADADRFEREVKDTAAQFEHIVNFMPEKMGAAELTTIISEQASRAGVRVMKTEPTETRDSTAESAAANFYTTSSVKFSIEGSFNQIATFLSYISRVPKLLTFSDVVIASTEGGSLDAPKLTFDGAIVGYRYKKVEEPALTADGSQPSDGSSPEGGNAQ